MRSLVQVRLLRWLLSMLAASGGMAQSASAQLRQEYVISVGTAAEKVATGTLWLYSYSWYGLEKIQLAAVRDGRASIPMDVEALKRELNPHPDTDAYVVVLQTGEQMWYRTPNIPAGSFWNDVRGAVGSLGTAAALADGAIQLNLTPAARRHITIRYPDGHVAAANTNITVSIYLWDMNHCASHEGLPLGTFRTDKTGTIEVLAPLTPLYLEDIMYYEEAGTGPLGVAYAVGHGLKTGREGNLVLTRKWELVQDDYLFDDVEVRVLTAAGRPRKGVDVLATWNSKTCGGGDAIGHTDSRGITTVRVDPSFTSIRLEIGGPYSASDPRAVGKSRDFTDAEIRELFARLRITIRW